MLRSHAAGLLREGDAGQQVTLAGWVARRRDHGGVIFIDLRDASGIAQVVFRDPQDTEVLAQAHRLRAEFCVSVAGVVEIRPEGNANPEIATGEIEVNATSLTVLGECAPLPFQLDEPAGEELRLKYRYLDLRRDDPAAAIRLRSRVNAAARAVLARHDFVEIETPTITRSTPEGARDFLVPARLHPGSFYALPQSPQLFKQLLMVAGMERYYQIARCYRDEDFRADRQPEYDGVDPTTYWVINIGGDLDTRTLSGRGRQLFYRRPQPNLLKHCRMQLEGGLPQPLRRALQSGQRASDALVAGGYGIQLDELLTRGQHVLQRSIVNGFRNPPLQHLRGRHRLGKQFRPQRTQAGNRTGMPLLDANHHQGRGAQERIEREPKYCLGPSNRAQHHGVSQHRDCESD